ncbi:uncharacterized protein BYT42DRAFT_579915 [Radiomyces spectabilis]|uniref:uncharacterized protein n=1 Tax=Radiomyces spectabilis TaxID=64574 RepID=UPI0022206130|nr:uncharacterized protein BYT42DRAFT_579915 [Radiomyces spectabilis]KAI8371346.1 hypothetical protein BYT42DRAFT_579915 [Radiomyces spectabilis]
MEEVSALKERIEQLRQEHASLADKLGVTDEAVDQSFRRRIGLLHEYNGLKDIALMLLDKYAGETCMTKKEVFEKFDLDNEVE